MYRHSVPGFGEVCLKTLYIDIFLCIDIIYAFTNFCISCNFRRYYVIIYRGYNSRMSFILCPVRIHSNVQRAGAFDYRLRRTFFLKDEWRGRKGLLMSEEQQITEFVGRFSTVSAGGSEMAANPSEAVKREGFSPRVAQIVTRLVPHLSLDQSLDEIFKPGLQYW